MSYLAVPPTIVKLVTRPSLPACTLNQKQNKTLAINTRLISYTFTKLGDNLTNNYGDVLIANSLDVKYIGLALSSGLN